jgi:hypothetical protein
MKDRSGHQQQNLDLKRAVRAHGRCPTRKKQRAGQEADREAEQDRATCRPRHVADRLLREENSEQTEIGDERSARHECKAEQVNRAEPWRDRC